MFFQDNTSEYTFLRIMFFRQYVVETVSKRKDNYNGSNFEYEQWLNINYGVVYKKIEEGIYGFDIPDELCTKYLLGILE